MAAANIKEYMDIVQKMKEQLNVAISSMGGSKGKLAGFAHHKAKAIRKLEVMSNDMKTKKDIDDSKKNKSANYLYH